MSLSIIVVLKQNFVNTFIKIAILRKIYLCSNCYAKLEQHWIERICVHNSPVIQLFEHKKSALSISAPFHKKSLIVTCCTFGRFKIRTLTPNRFKCQTNDTLTLLGHNYNHQRRFLKQKIVTLHRCGFNLKFPKHCYFDHYFGQTLSMKQQLLKIRTILGQMIMCPQQPYYKAFISHKNWRSPTQALF